jgi:hypothetical protein
MAAPNTYSFSALNILEPKILRHLLDFWNIYAPSFYIIVIFLQYLKGNLLHFQDILLLDFGLRCKMIVASSSRCLWLQSLLSGMLNDIHKLEILV